MPDRWDTNTVYVYTCQNFNCKNPSSIKVIDETMEVIEYSGSLPWYG